MREPSGSIIPPSAISPVPPQKKGAPRALTPGATYRAEILGRLDRGPGGYTYEIRVLGRLQVLFSERDYPLGTLLELVPVKVGTGYRLQVSRELGVPSPESPTRGIEEAPSPVTGDPRGQWARVTRALLRAGVVVTPETVRALADRIQRDALPEPPAVQAAIRLLRGNLPLEGFLLRGGAAVEHSLHLADPAEPVAALLRELHRILPPGARSEEIIRELSRGAGLEPVAPSPPQPVGSSRPEPILRLDPVLLERALTSVVRLVLSDDVMLESIRIASQGLREAPSSSSAPAPLGQRLRELVASLDSSLAPSRPVGTGELPDLSPPARLRALEVLAQMQKERIESHPEIARLRPLLQEIHRRVEALAYVQVDDGVSSDRALSFLGVALGKRPQDRLPYRISVRDERERPGRNGEVSFRLEVDSPLLGSVEVRGRLDPRDDVPLGELRLDIGAVYPQTVEWIRERLPELLEALGRRGYRPSAEAGALRIDSERDLGVESSPTGLDVKG